MKCESGKILAELIGTFALVFFGTGSVITADTLSSGLGVVGIALTFGLIVMVMIYAVGNISGAHFNPAVTIAFWAAKRFPGREVLPYLLAQFGGAITASFLLAFLFPDHTGLGATRPADGITTAQAAAFELILSFTLMFVILNVSTDAMEKGIMAGVAVGSTVALCAMMGGPVCGASMNPARSLGPALASGQLQHLWLYLTVPVLGTALATPFCKLIQGQHCCNVRMDNNGKETNDDGVG